MYTSIGVYIHTTIFKNKINPDRKPTIGLPVSFVVVRVVSVQSLAAFID